MVTIFDNEQLVAEERRSSSRQQKARSTRGDLKTKQSSKDLNKTGAIAKMQLVVTCQVMRAHGVHNLELS
jgi:hypothetical protein